MRRTLKNRTCAVILAGTLIAGCQAGTAWAGMAETLPMTGTERAAVVEPAPVMETDGTGETTKESGSETLENIALTRLENDGIAAVKTDGVEAGADQFSTKVTYQTYDPDANAAAHLPETVEVNGETYHVLEWKTPLVVSKEATRPRTMSYESEVFTGDEAEHMPEQEVTGEDGLNYVLQSKTLNAQTTKERSEYKETTVSYKGVEAGVQIQDNQETGRPNAPGILSEESEKEKEGQLEKMLADNKQSFFAHVASRVKKAFQGAAGEQKEEEKETEEETLQPDKADEPEQEKEVSEVNLDTDPEELQEFRPKQTGEDGKPDDVDSVKTNGE